MASQPVLGRQGRVASVSAVSNIADVREMLQTLLDGQIRLRNVLDELVTAFNAHTHFYDSATNADGNTSGPDSTAATEDNTVVAALAVTGPAEITGTG